MKRIAYLLLLLAGILPARAQSEGVVIDFDGSHRKDFGGFILDMGTMLNTESLTLDFAIPPMSLLAPWNPTGTGLKLNPDAFKLKTNATYLGATTIPTTGISSILYPSSGYGPTTWQGTSYKLNNGMRINLYGEYDADGNKVRNPAALPWQHNQFNAAFEMKSANGNFGIKVEVHGGRKNPY